MRRSFFLGLNPGGATSEEDHARYAMSSGSAYEVESWAGYRPGTSPLQRQVLALFRRIGVKPDQVLAGNIVPFRSPSWADLPNKKFALDFGKLLWRDILSLQDRPLVIAMGSEAIDATVELLDVSNDQRVPVNWGSITAVKGQHANGRFVGLPHLSRFAIVERPASQSALDEVFN